MYAQREKGYIALKIAERVSASELGTQIAQELMNRDYSIFNAQDYTIRPETEENKVLPKFDIVDTLSETDLSEFTLDKWIALYQKAKAVKAENEVRYLQEAAKVERVPHEIPYTAAEFICNQLLLFKCGNCVSLVVLCSVIENFYFSEIKRRLDDAESVISRYTVLHSSIHIEIF
ncbi:MAG: hypothetical protein IKL31_04930 [Ruminococcus sp.]|nr:hypothetical protein [Ruminococcus sp.]